MRLVIEVRQDFVNERRLHLCIVKGNYLPPEFKIESYIIESSDNRYFKNTGERGLFEDLRETVKEKKDLKKLCLELSQEGKTLREIEVDLKSQGFKISKSTIGRYLNKGKN